VLTLALADAAATARAGQALAGCVAPGMVVTLAGDLGAGKTTLVRALLRAAGVTGPVKSPTFDLVEHYPLSNIYFYHIDLYRFVTADDWEGAGLAECFGDDTVCLVEWPGNAGRRLDAPDLALELAWPARGEGRVLRAQAHTGAGERCLRALTAAFQAA
jgi:tRNA threonylcarbamoyladenosine biosynthesis protein TsaE